LVRSCAVVRRHSRLHDRRFLFYPLPISFSSRQSCLLTFRPVRFASTTTDRVLSVCSAYLFAYFDFRLIRGARPTRFLLVSFVSNWPWFRRISLRRPSVTFVRKSCTDSITSLNISCFDELCAVVDLCYRPANCVPYPFSSAPMSVDNRRRYYLCVYIIYFTH
jgi:hypothetical protein